MKPNDTQTPDDQTAYLFNVDIMVKGVTNAQAMEKLLRMMNGGDAEDFRIVSGANLGIRINQMEQLSKRVEQLEQKLANTTGMQAPPKKQPDRVGTQDTAKLADAINAAKAKVNKPAPEAPTMTYSAFSQRINAVIEDKRLIRLKVNRGAGVMLSIPCRVLSYDERAQTITVYHVDEKQVYTFKWTEIEDFIV
ncbi:hypothetical protein [Paenibacillus methanolicus]|uniref:Uncharacterized protein n=1 Tax=Paenibacillus methanolicus TaxID=582686 RepID=A0A5S5BVJ7_9BACL|nr:hypothetical protein [Paenibacillus methanolicus]TYP71211.1 hypothetical protein BCM02_110161 [Paenibacillus methanolicus]